MSKRVKYVIGGVVVLLAIGGFAAFRPDTLFTNNTVNDTLDPRVAAALQATSTPPASSTTDVPAPSTPTTATGEPTPTSSIPPAPTTLPQPAVVSSGEWTSIEHETSGTVAVVADGSISTLVLADLATSNGPDLAVYLSPLGPEAGGDYTAGAVRLGPLKGNLGTQTYELPTGTDVTRFSSVVIWCDRFSVGFGVAGLEPA